MQAVQWTKSLDAATIVKMQATMKILVDGDGIDAVSGGAVRKLAGAAISSDEKAQALVICAWAVFYKHWPVRKAIALSTGCIANGKSPVQWAEISGWEPNRLIPRNLTAALAELLQVMAPPPKPALSGYPMEGKNSAADLAEAIADAERKKAMAKILMAGEEAAKDALAAAWGTTKVALSGALA